MDSAMFEKKMKECKRLEQIFLKSCDQLDNYPFYKKKIIESGEVDFDVITKICNDKTLFKIICLT